MNEAQEIVKTAISAIVCGVFIELNVDEWLLQTGMIFKRQCPFYTFLN